MRDDTRPIRVLPVDDSPTIRRLISSVLDCDAGIDCLPGAAHPLEAREMIKAENPDVLILDIDMPHMSGLDFLRKVMTLRPMPVLMFSSLTSRGSAVAVEALSLGAVHCIGKTSQMAVDGTLSGLPALVRMAAQAPVASLKRPQPNRPALNYRNSGRVMLIGSSTGGVDALERVLSGFSVTCPPTLITQHMPAEFLRSFTTRLDNNNAPSVRLAEDGAEVVEGVVYVAPGGDHHLELDPGPPMRCRLVEGAKVSGHRPSVDVLFRSAVPMASRVVAAILTGMGSDGARAMTELRHAGAETLAQDQESCVVFGMPKVAIEMGGTDRVVPLDRIARTALDLCAAPRRTTRN